MRVGIKRPVLDKWSVMFEEEGWQKSTKVEKYSKKGIELVEAQANFSFSFYVVLSQGENRASSSKCNMIFLSTMEKF